MRKEELFTGHVRPLVLQGETFEIKVPASKLGELAEKILKQLNDPQRLPSQSIAIKGRRGTLVVPPQQARELVNEIRAMVH